MKVSLCILGISFHLLVFFANRAQAESKLTSGWRVVQSEFYNHDFKDLAVSPEKRRLALALGLEVVSTNFFIEGAREDITHNQPIERVEITQNGRFIIYLEAKKILNVYDTFVGINICSFGEDKLFKTLKSEKVYNFRINESGQYLALGMKSSIQVHSLETCQMLSVLDCEEDPYLDFIFDRGRDSVSRLALYTGHKGHLKEWDGNNGSVLNELHDDDAALKRPFKNLSIDPHGVYLLSGMQEHAVVWNTNFKVIEQYLWDVKPLRIRFSPNGNLFGIMNFEGVHIFLSKGYERIDLVPAESGQAVEYLWGTNERELFLVTTISKNSLELISWVYH